MTKYKCNSDYFENIDNEYKAYWLGFLYADGCIRSDRNSIQIILNKKDKNVLYKFLIELNATNPIYEREKYNQFYICIDDCKLKTDLINKGCIPKKSLILTFPKWLDKKLNNHFIRGYFDGDGCIHINEKGYAFFNIVGTKDFCLEIQKILIKECKLRKTKFGRAGKNYRIMYNGNHQNIRIRDWLYENETICIKRKKEVFYNVAIIYKHGR